MGTSKHRVITIVAVAIWLALGSASTARAVVTGPTREPATNTSARGVTVNVAGVVQRVGHPESVVVRDGAGDVWKYHSRRDWYEHAGRVAEADVLGLQARHTASEVRVTLSFQDLRRRSPAYYTMYLQTGRLGRYVFVYTDEKHWRGRHYVGNEEGDQLSAAGVRHWVSYRDDTVTVWMPRSLLRYPVWVRGGALNYLDTTDNDNWYEDNPLTHDPVRSYPPILTVPIYHP